MSLSPSEVQEVEILAKELETQAKILRQLQSGQESLLPPSCTVARVIVKLPQLRKRLNRFYRNMSLAYDYLYENKT